MRYCLADHRKYSCFFGRVVNMGLSIEMIGRSALVFPIAYAVAMPFILIVAPKLQKRIDLALAD